MSLQTIIHDRQRALFNTWVLFPAIQMQVEHPDQLSRLAFPDRRGEAGPARQLGGSSLENVALMVRAGSPDTNASVWVRAGYSGYQKAWLNFIEEVYGVKATAKDLAGYNIDHLYNRARSPGLAGFVRIEAVNGAVNQAWGRNFERAVSRNATGSNQRNRNTMSWTIAAKLMGQQPPRGPNDHQGIARLVQFFSGHGLSAAEAKQGVENMLTHAYWAR